MQEIYEGSIGYKTLEQALNAHTSDDLREYLKFLGLRTGTRKDERIAAIVDCFSGDRLKELWDTMDALTRYAIAEAAYNGVSGFFDGNKFEAKYGTLPPRLKRAYYNREDAHPMAIFDVLFIKGYLPKDLIQRFMEFVPPPPEYTLKSQVELPSTVPVASARYARKGMEPPELTLMVTQTALAALHDVIAILRLIDAGRISVSAATGKPSLSSVKGIGSVLRDGDLVSCETADKADDFIRALAWPLLVQNAGLAKMKGGKLMLTVAGKKSLTDSPQDTLKHIWNCWLKKSKFDEFSRINAIKGQKSKGRDGLTAVVERRKAVALALMQCPQNEWVCVDDFFQYFQATDMYFEVTHNPWKLYVCDLQYGNLGYDGYHGFSILQGRYIMALLMEYAATLGMIDIAHIASDGARNDYTHIWGAEDLDYLSRYDGLKYFRITSLGAYCLGNTESYTPAPVDRRSVFQVLPNQDIVLVHANELQGSDALFLERIARNTGDHTWTLDTARLLDSLSSGIRLEEMLSFLDNNSIQSVPDNVRIFLSDVARRATLVSYEGPADVYHAVDEATALLIAHDTDAKSICYLAGKTRLIVPAAKRSAFQRALRRLGFCVPSSE